MLQGSEHPADAKDTGGKEKGKGKGKGKGKDSSNPKRPSKKGKAVRRMISSKWKSWVFNFFILILVSGLIIVWELDLIRFRALGYECNDISLSHPYKGDTIPKLYLALITILVPLITMPIVEFVANSKDVNYRNSRKKKTLVMTLHFYGMYGIGLLFLLAVIQCGKAVIGEPRPHFFDTCKPDKVNCTGYVWTYTCTNKDLPENFVRDSHRSFPSGHSGMGWYSCVFMSWYFQSRIPRTDYLIVPFAQFFCVVWGLLSSLTRITDRRHHWWDVLFGSIFGIVFAVVVAKVLCKGFQVSQDSVWSATQKRPPKHEKNVMDTRSNI